MASIQITDIREDGNDALLDLFIEGGIGDWYALDVTHENTSQTIKINGQVDGIATRTVTIQVSTNDDNVEFSVSGTVGGLPVDDEVETLIGGFSRTLYDIEGFARGTSYKVTQGEELVVALKTENRHGADIEVTASLKDENGNVLQTLTKTVNAQGFWNPTFSTTDTEQLEEGSQQMCVEFTNFDIVQKVLI